MPKAVEDNGGLATEEVEASADLNSMDDGSSLSDLTGEDWEGIMDEAGVGPERGEQGEADPEDLAEDLADDDDELDSEDGDGDGQDDAEDAESEPEEEQDETEASQSQFDKLTRKRREAEEQRDVERERAEAAEAKLAELEAKLAEQVPEAVEQSNAFADVTDAKALDERQRKLEGLKAFLWERLDGFEHGGEEFTAEDVKAEYRRVEKQLAVDLPARREYLQQADGFEQMAKAQYPGMYKPGTYLHNAYVEALQKVPGLKQLPNARLVVGDAAVGALVRGGRYRLVEVQPESAKPGKETPGEQSRRKAPRAAARPSGKRANPARAKRRQAEAGLMSGSESGLEAFAESLL